MAALAEGETKRTPLPEGLNAEMVEQKQFGLHSIAVERFGVQKSKVYVRDYSSWQGAFEAAMDKAGL